MNRAIYIVNGALDGWDKFYGILSIGFDRPVFNFDTVEAFIESAPLLDAGVVLVNLKSGPTADIAFITNLARTASRRFAVVMVSEKPELKLVVAALRAGALNFLEQLNSPETVAEVIAEGLKHLDAIRPARLREEGARQRIDTLSPRERDVFLGLIDGHSNKIIAKRLNISPRTVEIYRGHLMTKLAVNNLSQAIRLAFTAGLVSND